VARGSIRKEFGARVAVEVSVGSFGGAFDRLDFRVVEVRLILNAADDMIEDENLAGASAMGRVSEVHPYMSALCLLQFPEVLRHFWIDPGPDLPFIDKVVWSPREFQDLEAILVESVFVFGIANIVECHSAYVAVVESVHYPDSIILCRSSLIVILWPICDARFNITGLVDLGRRHCDFFGVVLYRRVGRRNESAVRRKSKIRGGIFASIKGSR
jgi:hypothetical protein